MTGTIVNTIAILVGSALGGTLRQKIKPQWQQTMYTAMGLAALGLGFNAVCQNMPKSHYPVLFIVSLAIGGLTGTMLDLEGKFQTLVAKMKHTNVEAEAPRLAQGLSTGILLFCIGTLSILGPINSALFNDHTYLYTNATLDLVTSAVLAGTYGYGMALAAPVLFCWQGGVYLLAKLFGDVIPGDLLCEMSLVGGMLIAASGMGILQIRNCRTLNLLPALFVPLIFFLILYLFNIQNLKIISQLLVIY